MNSNVSPQKCQASFAHARANLALAGEAYGLRSNCFSLRYDIAIRTTFNARSPAYAIAIKAAGARTSIIFISSLIELSMIIHSDGVWPCVQHTPKALAIPSTTAIVVNLVDSLVAAPATAAGTFPAWLA
jgi:hypothetical protein